MFCFFCYQSFVVIVVCVSRQLNEERQQLLVARDKLMDKRRHLAERTKTSPSAKSSYHAGELPIILYIFFIQCIRKIQIRN